MGVMIMKKKILTLMLATMIMGTSSVPALAEWKKDNTGWWYSTGNSWATGWKKIDGKWYYFHSNGYMAYDETIDGYYIGKDGQWTQSNNPKPADSKLILTNDDFKTGNNDNLINFAERNKYTWAFDSYYKKEDGFVTNRNIKLGDSMEAVKKAYGNQGTMNVSSTDYCAKCPKWNELAPKTYAEYLHYYHSNYYLLRFYFNSDNKVVMIAYFENPSQITQNTLNWE